MKECGKIREQMAAYLAGELSPEGTAALRVHLESCPACREELEELSAAWNLTKSMLDSTAHDGTLPDESRAEIRRAMNPRRRFRVAPALWKIAAMFLVCGAILAVVVHSGRKSEVPRMKMNVFMSAEEVKENVAAAKTAALNRPGAPAPVLKTKREAVKVRAGSAEPMKPHSCDFALRQEAVLAVSAEAVELNDSRTSP